MDYHEYCHNTAACQAILQQCQRVLVVGLSPNPKRLSNQIARYLLRQDFQVTGINPFQAKVGPIPCYPRLSEVPDPLEVVIIVQDPHSVPRLVNQLLEHRPKLLWLEHGSQDPESEERARAAGVVVISDRNFIKEHQRMQARIDELSQVLGYG